MPWRNGGVIGKRNLPSAGAASGVWRLSELESANRDSSWPAGAVGSPSEVTGLVLWLDGADATTMYDATTGGSLVAVDAAVARWEDKSGSSRHFTQATSGSRPTRRAAVKNGLNAIEFTNDFLTGVHTYTVGTLFCVWNQPTTATGDAFAGIIATRISLSSKTVNGTLTFVLSVQNLDTSKVCLFAGGSTPPASHRLNRDTAAAGYTDFNIGQAVRTTPDRWQFMSSTFAPVGGSKPFAVGADTLGAARLMQNGHIGEVIAYSGTLNAARVASVEGYLVNKWGLA